VEERGIRERRLGERGAVVVAPWAEGEGGGLKGDARVVRGVVGSVVGGGPEGGGYDIKCKVAQGQGRLAGSSESLHGRAKCPPMLGAFKTSRT
jgi:hypothetical protein